MVLRTPLSSIDGNRQWKKELSPFLRGQITAFRKANYSIRKIATELNLSASTVQYTLEKNDERRDGVSLNRSGRPLILSPTGQRHVLTLIKRNPFITFNEIRRSIGVALSDATIRRTLEKSGYGHWKAGKRPRLDAKKAKVRLDFALKYRDWTWDEWRKVIWSDECSVEIGKGKRDLWCWRLSRPHEKWKKEFIQPYNKAKGLSIMIWAAIFGGGCSNIFVMNRDSASKQGGYTQNSYIEALESELPFLYMEPDWLFMQDNARIHTARKVKAWLEDHSISVMAWPPYSPDMNPIEHAWAKLKETIYKLDPDFESFKGTRAEVTERFLALIQRSWEVIGQDYFDDLVRSMDSRINAVISAKGWYTKY